VHHIKEKSMNPDLKLQVAKVSLTQRDYSLPEENSLNVSIQELPKPMVKNDSASTLAPSEVPDDTLTPIGEELMA